MSSIICINAIVAFIIITITGLCYNHTRWRSGSNSMLKLDYKCYCNNNNNNNNNNNSNNQ